MKDCPYCEAKIPNNSVKCKYCWEVVVEEKKVRLCPYCEAEVSETAKKCKHCWERIYDIENQKGNENINENILYNINYWRWNSIYITLFLIISILSLMLSDDLYPDIIATFIFFIIPILFEFLWNKNCFLEWINKEIKNNEIIKIYSYKTSLKLVYCLYFIACIILSVYLTSVNWFWIDSILSWLLFFLSLFWLLCWPWEYLTNKVILWKQWIYICRMWIFSCQKIEEVIKYIPYSNIKSYTLRENFFLDWIIPLFLAPFINYFIWHKRWFKLI